MTTKKTPQKNREEFQKLQGGRGIFFFGDYNIQLYPWLLPCEKSERNVLVAADGCLGLNGSVLDEGHACIVDGTLLGVERNVDCIAVGPAYYVLHPQKGITICLFF